MSKTDANLNVVLYTWQMYLIKLLRLWSSTNKVGGRKCGKYNSLHRRQFELLWKWFPSSISALLNEEFLWRTSSGMIKWREPFFDNVGLFFKMLKLFSSFFSSQTNDKTDWDIKNATKQVEMNILKKNIEIIKSWFQKDFFNMYVFCEVGCSLFSPGATLKKQKHLYSFMSIETKFIKDLWKSWKKYKE